MKLGEEERSDILIELPDGHELLLIDMAEAGVK